ncbi:MAG TPA: DUF2851 family protein [Verrucomicrobiota bacterium]|nr:DUF2851 family protein [Verrucomicrobiota bacterium]
MAILRAGIYEEWRAVRPSFACRDSADPPPERWLQQVWRHQRLRRDQLMTLDGRTVRVLHPGFWNREAGPDFRQAVLQLGDGPAVTGDVELDVTVSGWRGHHHATNPAYARVILHVVWDAGPRELAPPVLALQPHLDAPLAELVPWLETAAGSILSPGMLGKCCAPLRHIADEVVADILNQAAKERLRRKASEFAARARHAGWEQTLWEGLLAALGYKHNAWPMRRLAELCVAPAGESVLEWEARLLGLAGLLPSQPPIHLLAAQRVKRLWEAWWRDRERWVDQILPATVWRLSGLRPANHPQRRLALAARWLAEGTLPKRLADWLTTEPVGNQGPASLLLEQLQPAPDPSDFWAQHWTFRSAASPAPLPFLGPARASDLAVNVVLPWLWARASAGGNASALTRVEERFFVWPSGQDNALLRHARARLFAGPTRRLPRTAAAQQGLLQIIRDFCEPAGPLCSECRFPKLVEALPGAESKIPASPDT